jgi:hypothetical protein
MFIDNQMYPVRRRRSGGKTFAKSSVASPCENQAGQAVWPRDVLCCRGLCRGRIQGVQWDAGHADHYKNGRGGNVRPSQLKAAPVESSISHTEVSGPARLESPGFSHGECQANKDGLFAGFAHGALGAVTTGRSHVVEGTLGVRPRAGHDIMSRSAGRGAHLEHALASGHQTLGQVGGG